MSFYERCDMVLKKRLLIFAVSIFVLPVCVAPIIGDNDHEYTRGREYLSSEFVEELIGSDIRQSPDEESQKEIAELNNKYVWLSIDLEKARKEYEANPNRDTEEEIEEIMQELDEIDKALEALGVIKLTEEQVVEMFAEIKSHD